MTDFLRKEGFNVRQKRMGFKMCLRGINRRNQVLGVLTVSYLSSLQSLDCSL